VWVRRRQGWGVGGGHHRHRRATARTGPALHQLPPRGDRLSGWLYNRLADRFGANQVFKDVDSIPLGDDFVEAINRAVASCDVLLALIGADWLTVAAPNGRRRLDDPADFVRLEIEAALARQVRVIPILIDGATMPAPDELPESLRGLGRRQALELSPSRFEFDTSRLLRVLDSTMAEALDAPYQPGAGPAGTSTAAAAGAPTPAMVEPAPTAPPPPEPATRVEQPPGRGGFTTSPVLLGGMGVVVLLLVLIVALLLRQSGNGAGLALDNAAARSGDGLELRHLRAASQHAPPRVGDTVVVRYTLTNVSVEPIALAGGLYVGAREQSEHRDTDPTNVGTVLSPGDSVDATAQIKVTGPGQWRFWPCYATASSTCPDEWKAFSVQVA
jgi:hypothetical protein